MKILSQSLRASIAALEAARMIATRRMEAPEGFDPQAAATTINNYSTERAQVNPPNYSPLKPNQYEGRVRMAMFTRVYATEAAGDTTALCVIPKGARILRIIESVSATTGSATLSFGLMDKLLSGFIDTANSVSDSTTFFSAAAAQTTTAQVEVANTQALNWLYATQKECYLTVTTAAAAMAGQTLMGYLLYSVD